MQISGSFQGSSDLLWVLSVTPLKTKWAVYAPRTYGENDQILNPAMLNIQNLKGFNDHLIGSAICSRNGDLESYSGNLQTIQMVIRAISETRMEEDGRYLLDYLFSEEASTGTWYHDLDTINVVSIKQLVGNASKIAGNEYIKYDKNQSRTFARKFRRSLGLRHIKSYDDIVNPPDGKNKYDISWMYDAQGNKIKDYRIIHTVDQFELLKKELEAEAPQLCAVDTETTGTEFYRFQDDPDNMPEICGMSVSWKVNQGIYIAFMNSHMETLDTDYVLSWIIPWLNKRKTVAHNGLFDGLVFYSYGYKLRFTFDTLIQAFDLDSTVSKGDKGLKVLTRKYFNHNTLELEDILGPNFNAELVPEIEPRLIELYACADTDYTLQVFWRQLPQLKRLGRLSVSAFDASLYDVLIPAQYWGTHLDMDKLQLLSDANKADIERLEEIMYDYITHVVTTDLATQIIRNELSDPEYIPSAKDIEQASCSLEFEDYVNSLLYKPQKYGARERLKFSGNDLQTIFFNLLKYPVTRLNPKNGHSLINDEALQDLLAFKVGDDQYLDAGEYQESTNVREYLRYTLNDDVYSAVHQAGISAYGSDKYLVEKDKFNKYQYPFAYLLKIWRRLDKFRSSFYDKYLKESYNSWYYTKYSLTSADTARIINPIQTMEGSIKQLVVPFSEDYYMVVFDLSQIEFRVMLGLANNYWKQLLDTPNLNSLGLDTELESKKLDELIERLNNPEADYHREGGSKFVGCTPEDMTKKQRSDVKAIHFSVPYGAGAYSIAENKIRGVSNSKKTAILTDTQALLNNWQKNLYPLYYYLEYARDVAETPATEDRLPELLTREEVDKQGNPYMDRNGKLLPRRDYGIVTNPMNRARYFPLQPWDEARAASIRRMAGNFPIQSFARDIFFTMIKHLHASLEKDGLTGIPTKDRLHPGRDLRSDLGLVHIHNFVHDEATLQVHKSIHPYRIYKYIDACMKSVFLPGFPRFYMGISIVDNWYQGKLDEYEAIESFVEQKVKEYDENPEKFDSMTWDTTTPSLFVFGELREFMRKRVVTEMQALELFSPNTPSVPIELSEIQEKFKNYYVKPRLSLYFRDLDKMVQAQHLDILSDSFSANCLRVLFESGYESQLVSYRDKNGQLITAPLCEIFADVPEQDEDADIFSMEGLEDLELGMSEDTESFEWLSDYEDREAQTVEYYNLTTARASIKTFQQQLTEDCPEDAATRTIYIFHPDNSEHYLIDLKWFWNAMLSVKNDMSLSREQREAYFNSMLQVFSQMVAEIKQALKSCSDPDLGKPLKAITSFDSPPKPLGITLLPGFNQGDVGKVISKYTKAFEEFQKALAQLKSSKIEKSSFF